MRSLQQRLTIGLGAVLALLVAAGGVAMYLAVRAALIAQFDDALRVKAMVVITATDQRRGDIDVEFSDRFLREFDDDVATDFFQVWDEKDGEIVDRSDSLGRDDLPKRFGTAEEPEYWNLTLPKGGEPGRAIGIKFTPRHDRRDERTRRDVREAVVVVATRRDQLDAILRRVAAILGAGGGLLLMATLMAVPLVLRPGLRPLRDVARQAGAIDASNLAARFPTAGMPAELRPICERLNALLARLEESFGRERRFSADLAHELLTPLAELRMIAESALKWPDDAGPETHRQSLDILARMEALVTRLLELTRAENRKLEVRRTTFDAAALVRDTSRSFMAAAQEKNVALEFAGPDAAIVANDPALLGIVMQNLFSNAVEYTPAGSSVRIAWSVADEVFELRVANAAPQLSGDDVRQMFDRFWRKDPARTGTRHAGLGLALSRELAETVGATLTAALAPGGIVEFTLRVPREPAD